MVSSQYCFIETSGRLNETSSPMQSLQGMGNSKNLIFMMSFCSAKNVVREKSCLRVPLMVFRALKRSDLLQTNDAFLFICCTSGCAFFMVVDVLVGANKAQARGRHKEKRFARLAEGFLRNVLS